MSFPVDGRLAFACALAAIVSAPIPSAAQSPQSTISDMGLRPSQSPEPASEAEAPDPTIDWSVLNIDAASLLGIIPARKNVTIVPTTREPVNWNRTDNRDGSAAVTVNRPLPTVWDTKIGVDLGLAAPRSPMMTPDRLLAGAAADQSSGAAWARTTAPALNLPIGWDKASLDARFDPVQDQSKLGTRLSKSVPLGEDLSMTMESGFAVTHIRSQPLPDALSGTQSANVFDTDRIAKLNFLGTGTSLGAGTKMSTADGEWLRSLSAEQKLFDGISITGTVSETPDGQNNKSLTAGFKRSW